MPGSALSWSAVAAAYAQVQQKSSWRTWA